MKVSKYIIGLLLFSGVASSCDNIDEEDRHIKVEKPAIDNPRNLLIMEFTGNSCSNCPTGAAIVEQVQEEESPGRVIAVGLHPYGNNYTDPVQSIYTAPEKQDLRSEIATVFYNYYKPNGFPSAVFNGQKSSMSTSTGDWATIATKALEASSALTISATCEYDDETRLLTVDYTVEFLDDVFQKLNLTVLLVENKIMGTQTMPDGKKNLHYEHNHVIRASLNGDWGEELGASFDEGSKLTGRASMTLNEKWVAENCDVVVYAYLDENKEVEQATSVSVVSEQ